MLAALIANAALLVIEAAGGLAFGSLVLMADAGHLLADVSALAVSVAAIGLARRRPTAKHTFGFERAEVLAAQLNALLLVAVMAWVVQEAIHRLAAPPPVQAGGMLAVAVTALAVNGASSVLLARAAGRSLNMRGAYIHLAVDAAGSLTAIAAAALILGWGLRSADPVASLITAALAAWAVFGLIRGTTHVLMEGAPRGLDARQVEEALLGHPPRGGRSSPASVEPRLRCPCPVRPRGARRGAIARRRPALRRGIEGDACRAVRDRERHLGTRMRTGVRGADVAQAPGDGECAWSLAMPPSLPWPCI